MSKIYREYDNHKITNLADELQRSLQSSPGIASLRPGMVAAISVGSRGISGLNLIVGTIVDYLRSIDVTPIVIPTMGSHGGATARGQVALLDHYGVSEKTIHAEIVGCSESTRIGTDKKGNAVFVNNQLIEMADVVIPVARIKPHTSFKGPIESGIHKMIAIGFGGPEGAMSIHKTPFTHFSDTIVSTAQIIMNHIKIPCAVAVVEDAYDNTGRIEVVEKNYFLERERELLKIARSWLPRIPVSSLDILIVSEMGKNISGSGMDPNIIGRGFDGGPSADINIHRIVVLDLTDETEGNAAGIGRADIITKRLCERIDWNATYTNHLTSRMLSLAKMPLVASSDCEAVYIALKSLYGNYEKAKTKIAWINDTAHIDHMMMSAGALATVEGSVIVEDQRTMTFEDGRLTW